MYVIKQFERSSVRYKLLSGFLLAAVLLAAFGAYLVFSTGKLGTALAGIDYEYQALQKFAQLEVSNAILADSVKAFIITRDAKRERLYDETSNAVDRVLSDLKTFESIHEEAGVATRLAEFEAINYRLKGTELLILAKTKSGDLQGATDLFDRVYEGLRSDATRLLNDMLVEEKLRRVDEEIKRGNSLLGWIRSSLTVLVVALIAAVVGISLRLAPSNGKED